MFTGMCLSTGEGGSCSGGPAPGRGGGGPTPGGVACSGGCLLQGAWYQGGLVLGGAWWRPPDSYCCGRYACYWNAFLLVIRSCQSIALLDFNILKKRNCRDTTEIRLFPHLIRATNKHACQFAYIVTKFLSKS